MSTTVQTALSTINWPTAFAIVASFVTLVTGYVGFLIKTRGSSKGVESSTEEIQHIHSRVSEVKDRLAAVEGDIKIVAHKIESIQKLLDDHQTRDDQGFDHLNEKLDKVTDILLKFLSDERL